MGKNPKSWEALKRVYETEVEDEIQEEKEELIKERIVDKGIEKLMLRILHDPNSKFRKALLEDLKDEFGWEKSHKHPEFSSFAELQSYVQKEAKKRIDEKEKSDPIDKVLDAFFEFMNGFVKSREIEEAMNKYIYDHPKEGKKWENALEEYRKQSK